MSEFFGLPPVDLAVVLAYFLATTLVGVWLVRKVRSATDFFMPRRYGKAMLMMASFGAGTSADQAVAVAAKSFQSGLSGIWYQWLWLLGTPFYWIVGVILRRSRAVTVADMVESRFDRSFAMLYACIAVVHITVNMGVMLKGSGAVIAATSGGLIDPNLAIAAMTAMFLFYGVCGGLAAAIVTDFFQGILTIFFSFLLLPYALSAVGGMSGLRAAVHDPSMFSLVADKEINLFYVLVISVNGLISIIVYPNMMGVCGPSKNEFDSRFGLVSGNFVKRICTMAWCLTGLAAAGYYARHPGVQADQIYGLMARDFLPSAMTGLLGLFVSGVLASVMSACSAKMINCAALFTQNFYRAIRPARPERHYVWVGRAVSAASVAGGLLFAYYVESVVKGLEILWCIIPATGMVFWIGLVWRGATVAGAWAGVLAGLVAWWLSVQSFFLTWLRGLPIEREWSLIVASDRIADGMRQTVYSMSLPWQMVLFLSSAAAACILASWFTPKVAVEKLDRFYALVRTPVQPGEVLTQSCRLPAGIEPAPRRNLIPCKSIELPVPTPTTVLGVLAGSAVVAAMIGGFYWFTQAS